MGTTGNYIFVTGAARSGTHLLATLIHESIDCEYLGENNDFWRSLVPDIGHDMIPASRATTDFVSRFHDKFGKSENPDGSRVVFLDKTASNSLRLPFLYRLFPEAKFLHIIRDGRDVALSVSRKYQGDMRKITKVDEAKGEARQSIATGRNVLGRKLKSGLLLKRAIANPGRYIAAGMRTLGFSSCYPWGPAVPGLKTLIRSHSVLEVAAYQWRCSVECALAFPKAFPEALYHEVRYEKLIANPEATLQPIAQWLGVDINIEKSAGQIVSGGKTHLDLISDAERQDIHAIAGSTLSRLDYL